jgi:hypothetical protein
MSEITEPTAEVQEVPVEVEAPVVESQPQTIDEKWDNLDIFANLKDSEESGRADDEVESPSNPFPSEESKETEPAVEVEVESIPEPEEAEESQPEGALSRLSRKELRVIENKIIQPFRDPEAPIESVYQELVNLNPNRAEQVAQYIVNESLNAHPDAWLQAVTGIEGLTVAQVKERLEGNVETAQPAPINTVSPDEPLSQAVKSLNEFYGEAWKDSANDSEILEEHKPFVQAIRAQLNSQQTVDAEKEALRKEIASLKPQVDEIKSAQESEYEQKVESAYQESYNNYHNNVMGAALKSVLPELGLTPQDGDTADVKAFKELIAKACQTSPEKMSRFEQWILEEYQDKPVIAKVVGRVDTYLKDAAKAETQAKRTKDKNESAGLEKKAASLRNEASREQDSLQVLTQKALKNFLSQGEQSLYMKALEENANLKRQIAQISGRPEIVGQTAVAANTVTWQDKVKEAAQKGINPFDLDISEQLAAIR